MARPWPLRTRLIAAVLALVALALIAISAISYLALKQYLVGRIDDELIATARRPTILTLRDAPPPTALELPTNWLVALKTTNGMGDVFPSRPAKSQPAWPQNAAEVSARLEKPYTSQAPDGTDWRLYAFYDPYGQLVYLGQSLTDVEGSIHRFVIIELIVGGATLLIISAIGAEVIRRSLRPLTEIEKKAAAISGGDLTQRVPEYEPNADVPRTEVGTLGRTLNTMLTQIELAFRARAESESRAQSAAVNARDAAVAAQQSEARARRSEERMREFAADASHELRTPLTTIRGFAELYRQGAARDPAETARLMRRIEDEAQRMGMLVDDLLLLARLDQERPLEQLPVDLRVIAAEVVSAASAIAPNRTISVEVVPGTGSLIVIGDELRLRQVVSNLMTNAITYTPDGSPVTVQLSVEESLNGGHGDIARLEVIDTGPGLSADQVKRVFERFYRADSARGRGDSSSGTGLGLAIVAALVKAHGGTVDVTSTPGEGSTFTVRLPRFTADNSDPADDADQADAADQADDADHTADAGPDLPLDVHSGGSDGPRTE
jgi:two-component system OmpR family sensor kinase